MYKIYPDQKKEPVLNNQLSKTCKEGSLQLILNFIILIIDLQTVQTLYKSFASKIRIH